MTSGRPTRVVLLGHPVAQSKSPAFQNAALARAGIAARYEALDVAPDALDACLAALQASRTPGNVTIPHKRAVYARCAGRTEAAERAGAVNTFWWDAAGALQGDNTDVLGFEAAADALGVARAGCRVACLGSGGAATAACAAVAGWPGARLTLVARHAARAAAVAARFASTVDVADDARWALAGATLVVNATPIGMQDESLPVPVAWIPADAAVMDLVYRTGDTAWVRAARAAGRIAIDGREMLLHQGAAAFARWFGIPPDLMVMRDALARA